MNGRLATLDEILALFAVEPDSRDAVDNPVSGERVTFLTFGALQIIFLEDLDDDFQPMGVTQQYIHTHTDADSAAACHRESVDGATHEVAEDVAMAGDPTVALSRLGWGMGMA